MNDLAPATPAVAVDSDDVSFSKIFAQALRGEPCSVVGLAPNPVILPMDEWTRNADQDDHGLLALCHGPTIDVGCGPGRLAAALGNLGHVVLGIDVVREAVGQTRGRGVLAIKRDVFDVLPGEGRWRSALLADGNIGIGGDPAKLLGRVRQLIDPRGRVVVELEEPGSGLRVGSIHLECGGERSRPFPWALVGVDVIGSLADEVGLRVHSTHQHGTRWSAVLEENA